MCFPDILFLLAMRSRPGWFTYSKLSVPGIRSNFIHFHFSIYFSMLYKCHDWNLLASVPGTFPLPWFLMTKAYIKTNHSMVADPSRSSKMITICQIPGAQQHNIWASHPEYVRGKWKPCEYLSCLFTILNALLHSVSLYLQIVELYLLLTLTLASITLALWLIAWLKGSMSRVDLVISRCQVMSQVFPMYWISKRFHCIRTLLDCYL